jgi:4-amino-4-deoxy-L-arabinose transferase-like glycosyltransferase
VRELVRQNLRYFVFAILASLALRVFFLLKFPHITDDSRIYADIAKNWLLNGVYGRTYDPGQIVPTDSRLPGYPAFLALVFAIFGIENYRAVMVIQVLVDLGTCFVIADVARRSLCDRAAKAAFLLTGLCPFLAQYSAAALTETLEIFFTALALDFAAIGLNSLGSGQIRPWLHCGAAVAACILLRPDGGLLLAAFGVYMGLLCPCAVRREEPVIPIVRAGLVLGAVAFSPLAVWGVRNVHTLHRWQFLAPRFANEVEEFVPLGFNRWVSTWIADYTSTEEVYWNVPGEKVDASNLPARAFDSPEQKQETLRLLEDYNNALNISPELDARFAVLAEERIRAHPLRYYVILPALKIADMWLRPRTEMLPPSSRWYEFDDDRKWTVLAVGLAVLNLIYVAAAIAGLIRGRPIAWAGLGISYIVLRSLFLGTMQNPESRYTLECFPIVIWFAAGLWRQEAGRYPTLTSRSM